MWSKSYSVKVKAMDAQKLWNVWTDINGWHNWQDDLEFANLEGAFQTGKKFKFRPKGGPTLELELVEVVDQKVFTDLTKFPLAKMLDKHELIQHPDGVELKTTLSIQGPLAFVWRKLVVEKIVEGLGKQTESLIAQAQKT